MNLFNRANRQYLHKVSSYYLKEDKLRKKLDILVKKYLVGILKEGGDKGIYLTKDISIGLYEIPSYNDSYSKLVAYFITPYDNINFKIVANLWETENLWKTEGVR